MLEKVKGDRCKGKRSGKRDRRIGTVLRKNGKLFKNRVCECGKEHWHASKICITCENALHKKRYGSWYVKKAESAGEIERQNRLQRRTRQIQAEVKEIEAADLSIDGHIYLDIERVLAGELPADQARKAVKI